MKKRQKKGFTLAEVLIVLGIIGIVAQFTIPNLVSDVNNQAYKAAWKNVYSNFSNAAISIRQDNGGEMAGALGNTTVRDIFLKYISAIKKCDYGQAVGNCWHNSGVVTYLDGQWASTIELDSVWDNAHSSGAILKDGTYALFSGVVPACTHGTGLICSEITIDVNGAKAPNVVGRDIFRLDIRNNDVKPVGFRSAPSLLNYYCSANVAVADRLGNFYCSTKYLRE